MACELATRVAGWLRPAWVEVDLDAIASNVAYLKQLVSPARVCAVVKADAYGHGAVPVARAALRAGATWLAVALAEEGHELREAGISAPVLVLSEPPQQAMELVVRDRLTATVYTHAGLEALSRAADAARLPAKLPVHVKVDTGMHRVGADAETAVEVARAIVRQPRLELEGIFTHLAVADEPANPFTQLQLDRLLAVVEKLASDGITVQVVHAANSAGALFHPRSRLDLVRLGISLYGLAPSSEARLDATVAPLVPALSLKARVSYCKTVAAGEGLSYGLRYRLRRTSDIATVPLGYADGVPRRLFEAGGEVLIGGLRRRVAGTVTMDQLLVDCGPASGARAGDEVVLIGRQGEGCIDAWEWAERLGTVAYEVTCGLSARLPRLYSQQSAPTTKSMQAVSDSMSDGSIDGNMAMRNWLRPSRR